MHIPKIITTFLPEIFSTSTNNPTGDIWVVPFLSEILTRKITLNLCQKCEFKTKYYIELLQYSVIK